MTSIQRYQKLYYTNTIKIRPANFNFFRCLKQTFIPLIGPVKTMLASLTYWLMSSGIAGLLVMVEW